MDKKDIDAMLGQMSSDKEGKGANGRDIWSPGSDFEGTKTIRILPPLKKLNEITFYFKHKVHWIDGTPYEDLEQTVYAPDGTLIHEAEKDPIQAMVKKLFRNSERGSDEWELAKSIGAKDRYLSRIIIRNPADPSSELQPVFYEYGPTIFNILHHIMTETDFGIIVDPKNGRDFNLTKKGKARQSKYETSTPAASTSMIFNDPEKIQKVFENAMKLDYTSLIEFRSAEEIQETLNEFLGIATKTQVVSSAPVIPAPVQQSAPVNNQVDESVDEDVDEDESDIDNILAEFSN